MIHDGVTEGRVNKGDGSRRMDIRVGWYLSHHSRTLTEILEHECSVCHMGSYFLRNPQGITGRPAALDFVNYGHGMSRRESSIAI